MADADIRDIQAVTGRKTLEMAQKYVSGAAEAGIKQRQTGKVRNSASVAGANKGETQE